METQLKLSGLVGLFCLLLLSCGDKTGDEADDSDNIDTNDSDTASDSGTDVDSESDTPSETLDATPLEDVSVILANTYALDEIPAANWTPSGVGAELGGYVPIFAFTVVEIAQSALTTSMGTMNDGVQDMCSATASCSGTIADNPDFLIGPTNLETVIEGNGAFEVATIHDLSISGSLVNGGDAFIDGTLKATVDFRDIYELFTIMFTDPTPEKICNTAPTMGFACEECEHDGELFCMHLTASNVTGQVVSGLQLTEVVAASAECAE
ncbi:MAG: hypothetical protein JXX29_04845 [Deltaproteobacteria bacterium]|nr:hypothetical protein [Deltaproteobacteria bacterium]MBN2670974.1 hypothetical protein [Deltaproteobacteria bacterium]